MYSSGALRTVHFGTPRLPAGRIGEERNKTWVSQVSTSGRHRCRRCEVWKSGVGIKVGKGSTMFRPIIVIWLVLFVLALTVVAFVSRLAEKYRLADRFSRVWEKPSLSPKRRTRS
jgi:hypothetical protein